jgi:hypothetical protein
MPAVDETLYFYEQIAHKIIEWVAESISVSGNLIVNVGITELASGNLELQVDCVARN